MPKLISSHSLSERTSISQSEIETQILKGSQNNSLNWKLGEPPHIEHPFVLIYDTIPEVILTEISEAIKLRPYLVWEIGSPPLLPIGITPLAIEIKIIYERDNEIRSNVHFDKYSRSPEERLAVQNKAKIFDHILKIIDGGRATQLQVHKALMMLNIDYYKSYSSFNRFLNEYRKEGIVNLLHKSRNSPKDWKRKWTSEHLALIGELYGQELDYREICTELKKYCEENDLAILSLPTVGRLIREHKIRTIYAEKRYGSGYVKHNICSHLEKQKPNYKMQVAEADGSRLQLPYRVDDESKWKVRFLTLYVILDVASNKTLGYSVDSYENKDMVLMAFFMMFMNTSRLPAFLRIDRSS
ncbi:MAG: hypothetical protein RIF34_11165, partial [Candidatus Kapaibacterium sp.]